LFKPNSFELIFEQKDSALAIMILLIRITDPAFDWEELHLNNFIFKKINKEDLYENIFNSFKLKTHELVKIKVIANSQNIDYARSVLVYTIEKSYEDDYNLSKELDRWFSLNK
jgi:hypothetical protein